MDNLLHQLHQRRVALGLVDLALEAFDVRARALDKLSPGQLLELVALPEDQRGGQLRAMELGQRRQHGLAELGAVGRSAFDDRLMYRWGCACGEGADRDYLAASQARSDWEAHAGIAPATDVAEGERRECAWEGCERGPDSSRRRFAVRADRQRQRWCCTACREADQAASRRGPVKLFGAED